MNYMKRLILILFLLMFTTALTYSQTPISLDGPGGLSILNSLTKSPLNQTNDSLNATNNTTDLNGTKGASSSDFWSWGTRPKNPTESYNYNANNTANNPLSMTSDLQDLNALAEQNSFASD